MNNKIPKSFEPFVTMDSGLGENKSSIELNDSVVAGDVIVNQQINREIICGTCGKMGDFNSYFCSDCDSRVCEDCYSRTKKRCWPCQREREKTLIECLYCNKEYRWKDSHFNKMSPDTPLGKSMCDECYYSIIEEPRNIRIAEYEKRRPIRVAFWSLIYALPILVSFILVDTIHWEFVCSLYGIIAIGHALVTS